jgi:glycerol-3-phosphate dehydrogenase (NAD(P)+)
MSERIGVIGAGSWGTALADVLARNGHEVTVWSYEPEVADEISNARTNGKYLPGVVLSAELAATDSIERAVSGVGTVVSVSPSHVVRGVMTEVRPFMNEEQVLVSASKGIELDTGLRMSQVLTAVLGDEIGGACAVLSGPSFAAELARRLPTAVTVASRSETAARSAQALFQNDHFRIYTQADVIGTELGGSLKNVVALAAGISDGLQLGSNARAALMTRGLAEIVRLAERLGGEGATLAGLAGVGDLILTCTGDLSRNRQVGLALGEGRNLGQILAAMSSVAEGVRTTAATMELSDDVGVEMPIVGAVYSILYEDVEPQAALATLMAREPKPERWS